MLEGSLNILEVFVEYTGVRKKESGKKRNRACFLPCFWRGDGNGLLIGADIIDEETEVAEIYVHGYLCKWNDRNTWMNSPLYIYMYLVMARLARSRFAGRSIGSIHDPVRHFLEPTRRQNQSRINIQSDPR